MIKKLLAKFLKNQSKNNRFKIQGKKYGINQNERCVEIPWSLSCYNGERLVLDIGYANAEEEYIHKLLSLNIPDLYGIDMAEKNIEGFKKFCGDIRQTNFEDNFFDLIFCISTIEHIGKDNTIYFPKKTDDIDGDFRAINEMRRILKKNGKIILTVPFGKAHDYGWFRHYDNERWQELIRISEMKIIYEDYFLYKDGWVRVGKDSLKNVLYQDNGAPNAAGLACVLLMK